MYPNISIIILNWNGWEDTLECLESIYQINYANYTVILVDNNSNDDSLLNIKKYCSGELKVNSKFFYYKNQNKPIKIFEYSNCFHLSHEEKLSICNTESNNKLVIIKNDKNYGYAEGNNVGLRFSLELGYDFILVLNNDTVVHKDFLNKLIYPMIHKKSIGIIGPKIYHYNTPNQIFSTGGKVNWYKGTNLAIKKDFKILNDVEYVSGCCMLIRKDLIDAIGLLPNDYFLYVEEIDYCIKAKINSFRVVNYPKSIIWHKISSTSANEGREYYITRNWFIFMRKYASSQTLIVFILWTITIHLIYKTFFILYKNNSKTYKAHLRGLYEGLFYKY
ncbi:MAG: glycosyltransferase family 2 protein [Methanobacterium sp.]|jgi:hypothetical protein|nr:glycosyltransferase family 2 protein [Methanobacterium sp.]